MLLLSRRSKKRNGCADGGLATNKQKCTLFYAPNANLPMVQRPACSSKMRTTAADEVDESGTASNGTLTRMIRSRR